MFLEYNISISMQQTWYKNRKTWRSGQNYKLLLSVESGLQEEGSRYKSFCRDHKFKQLHIFSVKANQKICLHLIFWAKIVNFLCQDLPGVQICQQVIEFRWNFETFENHANSAKMKYLETPKCESLTTI